MTIPCLSLPELHKNVHFSISQHYSQFIFRGKICSSVFCCLHIALHWRFYLLLPKLPWLNHHSTLHYITTKIINDLTYMDFPINSNDQGRGWSYLVLTICGEHLCGAIIAPRQHILRGTWLHCTVPHINMSCIPFEASLSDGNLDKENRTGLYLLSDGSATRRCYSDLTR